MVNKVKVGDKAPNFNLPDVENRTRSLKEFLGQKVVLVFFVGAFTSTCTKEICEFRDSIARLIDLKAQIVGIDINVPSANKDLAEKYRLPFPILSDCKREVIGTYGLEVSNFAGPEGESTACCWGSGCYPMAKRSIFILDEDGIVRYTWVSDNQPAEPSYEEIKKALEHIALEERTRARVITISRQLGSGGDEIARKVSKILGYAYFDKSLMVSVAKSIGISEEDIADFSEDTYKVRGFADRIFQRKNPRAMSLALKDNELIRKALDEEECLSMIQTVINNLTSRGKTVIVGRGGQAILKDKVGVFHVRIVAPLAVRVERIMESKGLRHEDALRLIEDSDNASAEYLRRFYNIDWEDPAIYDMVLNTGNMDLNTAARVIASVASQAPERGANNLALNFKSIQKILIPTDGSNCSIRAAEYGISIAKIFDAQIMVVYVINEAVLNQFSKPTHANVEQELKHSGQRYINCVLGLAEKEGVKADSLLAKGGPYEQIVHLAKELNMDLIVMCTHGLTSAEKVLIGSVTERVIEHSPCPILVIKAPRASEQYAKCTA